MDSTSDTTSMSYQYNRINSAPNSAPNSAAKSPTRLYTANARMNSAPNSATKSSSHDFDKSTLQQCKYQKKFWLLTENKSLLRTRKLILNCNSWTPNSERGQSVWKNRTYFSPISSTIWRNDSKCLAPRTSPPANASAFRTFGQFFFTTIWEFWPMRAMQGFKNRV